MRFLTTFASCCLLVGCAHADIGNRARSVVSTVVERAADVSDTTLELSYDAFCSQRFSLRAYQAFLSKHRMKWEDLEDWCGWSVSVPKQVKLSGEPEIEVVENDDQ